MGIINTIFACVAKLLYIFFFLPFFFQSRIIVKINAFEEGCIVHLYKQSRNRAKLLIRTRGSCGFVFS